MKILNIRPSKPLEWSLIFAFTLFIFATPSYLRIIQKMLENIFGDAIYAIFSLIAVGIAAAFLVWIIKGEIALRKPRLIWFLILSGIYIYFFATLRILVEREHLIKYGFLSYLIFRAVSYDIKDKTAHIIACMVGTWIGAGEELVQWQLPNRVGEIRDVILNIKSVILGQLVVAFILRPKVISQEKIPLKSINTVLIFSLITVILLASFITLVHPFGHRVIIQGCGCFVISFKPQDLKELTVEDFKVFLDYCNSVDAEQTAMKIRQRSLEGNSVYRAPLVYIDEANLHMGHLNKYAKQGDELKMYLEYMFLKEYYHPYMLYHGHLWSQQKEREIAKKLAPSLKNCKDRYVCSIKKDLYITTFSKRTLWITVMILSIIIWSIYLYLNLGEISPARR